MDVGAPEIIVVAIVVLILFGSRKLPDTARSIGRSLRIFKAETRGLREDEERAAEPQPRPLPPASSDVTVNGRPVAERDRDPR